MVARVPEGGHFGTIPLGALIAGGLGTALGVRAALWVTLTGYALSGTLLTRDLRAHKDLPVRQLSPGKDGPAILGPRPGRRTVPRPSSPGPPPS